ncbi:MAG: nucleoside kinase [Bacteriovoracia bacterium]
MKNIGESDKITVVYNNKEYSVDQLTTPIDFLKKFKIPVKEPVAAIINGHVTRLNKKMKTNSTLFLIELDTYQGQKIYESTVIFLFVVAFYKQFPNDNVFIQHSIHQGIFAEVKGKELNDDEIAKIEQTMKELVNKKEPIQRTNRNMDVFLETVEENERQDLVNLFKYYVPSNIDLYEMDGVAESFYLPLLPNAKYVKEFKLRKYQDGIAIIFPDFEKGTTLNDLQHHETLFKGYKEYHYWSRILKVRTVGQLNRYIMNEEIAELINVAEALHEKKVAYIADAITSRDFMPRIVLIAGPSSSGKTTFSKRLAVQLKVNGIRPVTLGLDNYFLERDETPKDAEGNYDFESLRAIDVDLFEQQLEKLLSCHTVELPQFDFKQGKKLYKGNFLKLENDQILIVEGIHGINPELTKHIEEKFKFKIYISPMTQLNIHRHDRVPTSDTRLLRRIVRDSSFRGYSAADTLMQWRHVRAGETQNIFPFQDEADATFNSALFYEVAVLKSKAEKELLKVERTHPTYAEAQRLLKFLSFFLPVDTSYVPQTSLVREFIGESLFKY